MHAADRLEFAPPPTSGVWRALSLALLAHVFLLAALTWGVSWKRDAVSASAEAELWSAVPQEAAPRLLETPPEAPAPQPEQTKSLAHPPPQAQPAAPRADIVLAKEKLRLKKEKLLEIEKQRLEKLKLEKAEKLKLDKLEKEKEAVEEKKKMQSEAKRKEALKAQKEKLDAQKIEAQRELNLKRMAGLAGATGAAEAKGSALRSSGPSASYAGRIVKSIKDNTLFSDPNAGHPTVKILVRAGATGTILSRRIVTPSGNKAWDDAVLRAIDKMDTLPRDVDGRIPDVLVSEGLELTVSL
jgi:colicin import membrane protein